MLQGQPMTDRDLDQPTDAAPAIGQQMAQGAWWTVMSRLGVQGIGFLSTLVLARLLVPADFGLLALANSFSAALIAVSEFSLDVVLIQNRQAGREHYDTAWTLSLLRNLLLAAAIGLGARQIAGFFGDARVEQIIYWLALATFIDGLQNIGIVDFRRDLAFKKDMVFTILGKFGGFVVSVPLAFLWRDYWALVAGLVAGAAIRVLLSFAMHPYRPRFTLVRWRELMGFSKWLILNNICFFLFNRSDTFVIGKLVGAQAVGIYGMGFDIANMTTSNLLAPLRRALFPAYATVSHDRPSLQRAFVDVFAFVMLLGTPLALGIGLVATPLIEVMLGPQWVATIPLIQVLSIYGFLNLISAGSGPIFLASGRPQYMMWVIGGSTLVMIPLLIVATRAYGALGAAGAVTVTTALAVLADFMLVSALLSLPWASLLRAAWRPALAGGAMAIAVTGLQAAWPQPTTMAGWIAMLAAAVAVGAVTYPAATLLLWQLSGRPDGAERQLLRWLADTVGPRLRRRRAGWPAARRVEQAAPPPVAAGDL
jgi:O-antigen/teichoic acid export membrane protein